MSRFKFSLCGENIKLFLYKAEGEVLIFRETLQTRGENGDILILVSVNIQLLINESLKQRSGYSGEKYKKKLYKNIGKRELWV